MKLLIVTQRLDRDDPILGFFESWVREFALRCDRVTVVAQRVGEHGLPGSVDVRSLGKERGRSLIGRIVSFWQHIASADADAVFVHMTPVWAVLGAPYWLLRGVPVYLWYEARGGGWALPVSLWFVRKVFSASTHGMPRATAKSVITGHGIDTERFVPGTRERDPHRLVTVGRITASKRLPILLECLAALPASCTLRIVGAPITPADHALAERLAADIARRGLGERVHLGPLSHERIVEDLQTAACFVHASTTSLDKAVLEAMACGCVVVSCADALGPVLPLSLHAEPGTMAAAVERVLGLPPAERDALGLELRRAVERDHGLKRLIDLLVETMRPAK